MDLLLRVTVILGVTWAACRLLPRATAATRHLLWHLAIVAVLLAPAASRIAPTFETPLLAGVPRVPNVTEAPRLPGVPDVREVRRFAWLDLWVLWPIGSIAVIGWYGTGYIVGARRMRRARQAPGNVRFAADALGARRVRVVIAECADGPFVRGIFRPSIVLPASAERWDASRLRGVLLHELAHVRRGDCRVQLLAQIACAMYWFNPLIWIAARALRVEREHACDDEVLAHGTMPTVYAADLLDLARAQQRRPVSSAILAMARPSELEHRLVAILEAGRSRTANRATTVVVTLAFSSLAVAVLGARAPEMRTPALRSSVVLAEHGDDPERAAMRLALDSSPDAIPGLIAALKDPDPQVREKAALGLGWRSDPRALTPLITALRDRDSQVREKAALALGSLADPRAIAPLEEALSDPDSQDREKVATGLMLVRMGGDPDANGKEVRAALSSIVNGLLQLTK
jgi:beta-lactamase regulating signal transducer with metallopeptidase domain